MKLYYSPGACSLSPHIVASEAGVPVELEQVNLAEHKTATGQDYMAVNPKGYVPALRLDDGSILTEGPAIVQYLADQKPALIEQGHSVLFRPAYQLVQELLAAKRDLVLPQKSRRPIPSSS